MSEEIDDKIIRFMQAELVKGRFEHTIREISSGTDLSYTKVSKGVERLRTRGLIDFRKRGSKEKFVPYYYLVELRESCKRGRTKVDK